MRAINIADRLLLGGVILGHVKMQQHEIWENDPLKDALIPKRDISKDTLMFRSIWGALKWSCIGALIALNLARFIV